MERVAMVLAAGFGLRLRPLSDGRAKCVIPFLNRPVLEYTLDWLRRCGFHRAIINLHHAPDSVFSVFRRHALGIDIEYSYEPEILGTGGGPRKALERLSDPFLIVNGDIATGLVLGPLFEHHRAAGALATLALIDGPGAAGRPRVQTTADGQVVAFPPRPGDRESDTSPVERGEHGGTFSGVHVVNRELIETVPSGAFCDIIRPLYREAVESGLPLHGIPLVGPWYEIGDPRRYLESQLASLQREDLPLALLGHVRREPGGYVHPHTHWENSGLMPPYLLGPGLRVKHGAYLRGVIGAAHARIGFGATLEDVVLWAHATVGACARLRRVIVLDGASVPTGTEAEDVVWTRAGPVPMARSVAVPAAASS